MLCETDFSVPKERQETTLIGLRFWQVWCGSSTCTLKERLTDMFSGARHALKDQLLFKTQVTHDCKIIHQSKHNLGINIQRGWQEQSARPREK